MKSRTPGGRKKEIYESPHIPDEQGDEGRLHEPSEQADPELPPSATAKLESNFSRL